MRKRYKVAFICVHNSCRSQIAEALGKYYASDVFESYQKVASTGILKYYGRHQDWANQSWLDADREMDKDELLSGLREFYGDAVSDDVSSIFNEMNPEGEYADPEHSPDHRDASDGGDHGAVLQGDCRKEREVFPGPAGEPGNGKRIY